MKLLLLCVLPVLVLAQQPVHKVTLTWTDNANPVGTTYAVYRATGVCAGSPSFVKIVSDVPAKTYDDTGIAPGNYCYQVTALYGGEESDPSPQAGAKVRPFPPGPMTTVVVQ